MSGGAGFLPSPDSSLVNLNSLILQSFPAPYQQANDGSMPCWFMEWEPWPNRANGERLSLTNQGSPK